MKINNEDVTMTADHYEIYQPGYSQRKSSEFYKRFESIRFRSDVYKMPITPRNTHQLLLAMGNDVFHDHEDVPHIPLSKGTLWEHQKKARDFLIKKRQCILAYEMRLGKSLATLSATVDFVSSLGRDEKTVVHWIAPISGCVSVENDIKKWYGSVKRFEYENNIKLTLINYEKWRNIWDLELFKDKLSYSDFQTDVKALFGNGTNLPRVIVFDEIHKVKTGSSKVGRVARGFYKLLEEVFDEDFCIWGLSGTPAPRVPTDWLNLIEVVRPGFIPEKSLALLEQKLAVCKQEQNDSGGVYNKVVAWKEKQVTLFEEEYISQVSLTGWKDEIFDLPPKQHEFIKLPISQETKNAIKFVESVTLGAATLRNKLRQVTDGFVYEAQIDPDKLTKKNKILVLPTPKVKQLKQDLNELKEKEVDRVCIFGGYHGTIEQIEKTCLELGWNLLIMTGKGWSVTSANGKKGNRAVALERLKEFDNSSRTAPNGEFWAVIGHPKSMSTGLELSACPVMIYYSHTDDGEAELQSIERAHSNNMNKELGLTIKHYIHLSIDRMVALSIKNKKRLQSISMGDIQQTIFEDLK